MNLEMTEKSLRINQKVRNIPKMPVEGETSEKSMNLTFTEINTLYLNCYPVATTPYYIVRLIG